MGAWNTKPFGNDTAGDWLWKLEKVKDDSVLKATLQTVLDTKEAPDAPACEEAVAAAAVIEAARREPVGKLPKEAKQWISERGFVPSDSLVQQSIKAVERIAVQSELLELWQESPSFAKWQTETELLLAGLRDAQKRPAPSRNPKPPSARLSLPKLIEKTDPDEESPLREKLRQKLEAIVDVNAPIDHINPPINLLAARGLIPEVERLIERGAEVHPERTNPLFGTSPLAAACAQGHARMAELLLQHGAKINRKHEMDVFVDANSTDLVKRVFTVPSALYRAVESGSIATVEILIRHGADLRDERAKREALSCHAMHYETLLHRAAASRNLGSLEMVGYLVDHGLELDARDSLGDTPLVYAIRRGSVEMIQKLLELGADVNAKDTDGNTALDQVRPDQEEVFKAIRKHGGKLGAELKEVRCD